VTPFLSPLGLAALEYARQGLAVFPLAPRTKLPLTPDGFKSATVDATTITRWWTLHPRANIGGVPSSAGLIALDIDTPACWALAQQLGLLSEPTHVVVTGGTADGAETAHFYFRHPAPASGAKLAETIIVRGAHGYVVLPPSVHPSGLAYRSDTTLADAIPLPPAAAALLAQASAPSAPATWVTTALTAPVTRGGRHDALVAVAGMLAAHGLADERGLTMLESYNRTMCVPPKDDAEVAAIWEYTARRELTKRADREQAHAAVDLSGLVSIDPPARQRTVLRVSELMQEPPTIPYLVHELLPEQALGVLWAEAGVGKTFVTLDIALHVALGRPWQGRATTQTRVLWVVGEGFLGMRARVAAWCAEHQTDPQELEDWLVMRRVSWDITSQAARYEVALELDALAFQPHLVVIDTLSSNGAPGTDDSSTSDMKALMDAARLLRDNAPATVLFTHHTGLADKSRMRGSSDLIGAVDVSLHLQAHGQGRLTLAVAKARDFARPEPLALVLVPEHGAQVVRSGDPVDLSTLLAATVNSATIALLTALDGVGGVLRGKELEGLTGLKKDVYRVLADATQRGFVRKWEHGYTLDEAGKTALARHKLVTTQTPESVA
jgi:AAA domain/Bifunctional DNA primase/polymerase, N-terminal